MKKSSKINYNYLMYVQIVVIIANVLLGVTVNKIIFSFMLLASLYLVKNLYEKKNKYTGVVEIIFGILTFFIGTMFDAVTGILLIIDSIKYMKSNKKSE